MQTKLIEYIVQPKATYRLKTDLMKLCDHEEGFEAGMLCHITSVDIEPGSDVVIIRFDLKPFKEVNVPLEKKYDGFKWSESFDSPYKENAKVFIYAVPDAIFEDHFELVDQSKTLDQYLDMSGDEVYLAIMQGEIGKEKFAEFWQQFRNIFS